MADPTPPAGDPAGAPTTPAAEQPAPAGAPATPVSPTPGAGRPPLVRRRDDRALAGVCAAVARHLGVDPLVVRIVAAALVFAGGAGVLAYLAGWLLIPTAEGERVEAPGRVATVLGVLVLVVAVAGPLGGSPFDAGPLLGFAALAAVGGTVWWVARDGGSPLVRRAGLAAALLGACGLLAGASFWTAALGGEVAVAIAVIAAAALAAAVAATGRRVWVALPLLLAVAVPLAAVTATDLRVDGGLGERQVRPASFEAIAPRYEHGAGELRLDLRDVDFAGRTARVALDVGLGEVEVLVPQGVCVGGRTRLGVGGLEVLDRNGGGVDLDETTRAPIRTSGGGRLLLDTQIAVGHLEVDTDEAPEEDDGLFRTRLVEPEGCA